MNTKQLKIEVPAGWEYVPAGATISCLSKTRGDYEALVGTPSAEVDVEDADASDRVWTYSILSETGEEAQSDIDEDGEAMTLAECIAEAERVLEWWPSAPPKAVVS